MVICCSHRSKDHLFLFEVLSFCIRGWSCKKGALSRMRTVKAEISILVCPGPSCSKLTMSLVNDSLKFTSSDTQIY